MRVYLKPDGRCGNAIFRFFKFLEICEYVAPRRPTLLYEPPSHPYVLIHEFMNGLNVLDGYDGDVVLDGFYQYDYKDPGTMLKGWIEEELCEPTKRIPIRELWQEPPFEADIVVHVRLTDFYDSGDLVNPQFQVNAVLAAKEEYPNMKVYWVSDSTNDPTLKWMTKEVGGTIVSASWQHHFALLRTAKVLVLCNSTFGWAAACLNEQLIKCWIPDRDLRLRPLQSFTGKFLRGERVLYPCA